jgi:hypothetical protein
LHTLFGYNHLFPSIAYSRSIYKIRTLSGARNYITGTTTQTETTQHKTQRKMILGNYFWQISSISINNNLNKCIEVKFTRALYLELGPILSRNVDKVEESMCTVLDHVD